MSKLLVTKLCRLRWAGVARVAAYVILVNFGVSYLLMRSAYAGAERTVQRLGNALSKQLGGALIGETQAVSVNGQLLFFAVKSSDLGVKAVLDRFDSNCQAHSGGLREQFDSMPSFQQRKSQLPESMRDPGRIGIMRSDESSARSDEPEGHLVCVAQTEQSRGLQGIVTGIKQFLATGDLSRIGDVRYVAARKMESGQTQVMAIWTEGTFNIEAMFPEASDAPGTDTPDVPRPPAATRRLSAVVPDHPYAIRAYDSALPSAELLRFYDSQMIAAGWTLRPSTMDDNGPVLRGPETRAFTRDGRALLIGVSDGSVTIVELGAMNRVVSKMAVPIDRNSVEP